MTFYFGYKGSKRLDIKFYVDYLQLDGIKTIVEPFCGSSATSYYCYTKLGFKRHYHINDIDVRLINFINKVREKGGIKYFMNKVKALTYKNRDEWLKHCSHPVYGIFYGAIMKGAHAKMMPMPDKIKRNPMQNERLLVFDKFYLRDKLKVTNNDYKEIFKLYQNDKTAFLFLDPPYLDSDNRDYKSYCEKGGYGVTVDNTKIYVDILDFIKIAKCKVLFIINKSAIMELIFKPYVKAEYDKMYQPTKKMTKHLIIANYDI